MEMSVKEVLEGGAGSISLHMPIRDQSHPGAYSEPGGGDKRIREAPGPTSLAGAVVKGQFPPRQNVA